MDVTGARPQQEDHGRLRRGAGAYPATAGAHQAAQVAPAEHVAQLERERGILAQRIQQVESELATLRGTQPGR